MEEKEKNQELSLIRKEYLNKNQKKHLEVMTKSSPFVTSS
jgi:hypothetical protein